MSGEDLKFALIKKICEIGESWRDVFWSSKENQALVAGKAIQKADFPGGITHTDFEYTELTARDLYERGEKMDEELAELCQAIGALRIEGAE